MRRKRTYRLMTVDVDIIMNSDSSSSSSSEKDEVLAMRRKQIISAAAACVAASGRGPTGRKVRAERKKLVEARLSAWSAEL